MAKGSILILASALCFALSTVFAKLIFNASKISPMEITFFRFSTGFIVIFIYALILKKSFKPKNFKFVLSRAIFNSIAVICFFVGIKYTTVTKSNMLNMTYPIFVFLLAPFINKEKISSSYYLYLAINIVGLYFFMVPGGAAVNFFEINFGDVMSLMSGFLAGFAITTLKEARKFDDTYIVLLYLMAIGAVITFFLSVRDFQIPDANVMPYVVLATVTSVAGQFFITIAYEYIEASIGALISSTRIIFGALFGMMLFSDPITARISIGGILIMLSIVGISGIWKKFKPK